MVLRYHVFFLHLLNNTGMMKEPVRALVTRTITYTSESTFLGHVFCIIGVLVNLVALRFSTLES